VSFPVQSVLAVSGLLHPLVRAGCGREFPVAAGGVEMTGSLRGPERPLCRALPAPLATAGGRGRSEGLLIHPFHPRRSQHIQGLLFKNVLT
jgi:hypothetical protein